MAEPRFVGSTLEAEDGDSNESPREPVIVLVHHASLTRVGEVLPVGRITEISRLGPSLIGADGRDTGPIDDPFVSRRPISLRQLSGGGFELANPGVDVSVGGAPLPAGGVHRIGADDVARGVAIVLAGRAALWLTTDHDRRGGDELGMFGRSAAVHALRAAVRDAAASRGPILVRGETGSGK